MRETYPFGLFAVPREKLVRLHASSGTTGKATVVGYTTGDLEIWTDLMARCLACAGARPGDILHNAYGYGLFTGGLGAHYGAERLGCTVVPVSGGMTERQVTLMKDFGAQILCATPSYALNIAEVAGRHGHRHPHAAAARRRVRRRALERRHAPRSRGAARPDGGRPLRPIRDHRPGRRLECQRGAQRPARLGGPFSVRGDRSGDARTGEGRRPWRARHHHADQRSAADAALPLARHHAARRTSPAPAGAPMCASCE